MLLEFQREFAATIGGPAEGPLRVYRNTVINGCVDALRANYPAVAKLLGDEMFEAVAADFAAVRLPEQPVLAFYGDGFADWLEEQKWIWDVAYLPDVARIERLFIEALFAADADPIEMAALNGRDDWLDLHLAVHPATRFDWLSMPAMSIWLAQRDEQDAHDFEWEAEGVLLTRPAQDVLPARLDRAAHRFLLGIRLGQSVGDAAIAASNICPATDIGPLFTSLVNAGAFAAPTDRSLS